MAKVTGRVLGFKYFVGVFSHGNWGRYGVRRSRLTAAGGSECGLRSLKYSADFIKLTWLRRQNSQQITGFLVNQFHQR